MVWSCAVVMDITSRGAITPSYIYVLQCYIYADLSGRYKPRFILMRYNLMTDWAAVKDLQPTACILSTYLAWIFHSGYSSSDKPA